MERQNAYQHPRPRAGALPLGRARSLKRRHRKLAVSSLELLVDGKVVFLIHSSVRMSRAYAV